jgi:hypothetical protein
MLLRLEGKASKEKQVIIPIKNVNYFRTNLVQIESLSKELYLLSSRLKLECFMSDNYCLLY